MTVRRPAALAKAHFNQSVSARPEERQNLHRHSDARLVLYLDGEMREEAFEDQARMVRGDYVFRPPYFAHANSPDTGGSRYTRLALSPRAVRDWIARHGWGAACGHVDLDQPFNGDDLLGAARPNPYAPTIAPTSAQTAATLLAGDEAPRVQDVAARLGLSPFSLTRRFAATFGMTPSAYRQQACLQRALRMLSEGSMRLAQIAVAAGYHDQSHLTVALRRDTGLTPGAFRRQSA